MLHPGEAGFIFFEDDNIGVPQESNFLGEMSVL